MQSYRNERNSEYQFITTLFNIHFLLIHDSLFFRSFLDSFLYAFIFDNLIEPKKNKRGF